MAKRSFARTLIVGLVAVAGMNLGCGKTPPGIISPSPSIPPAAATVTVASVSPAAGLSGDPVIVAGTGFLPGASLKMDGVAARVTGIGITGTTIIATVPSHAAGNADVVVTNPGGQSGMLTGGYTYEAMTLTASSNRVTAEDQLSVSWVTPGGRSRGDWIALLKIKDSSASYESGWWQYTDGAASGTYTLRAPAQPGEYEFRYLPDDGFIDAARSSPVTVMASASP